MLTKLWKANQQTTPAATSRPNGSGERDAIRRPAPQHRPEQGQQQRGAEQPELLPRDGEDEVGLLLGDEAPGGLGALEQALAEQPAGADGDARLVGVVADAARVELGVGEGGEPVDLVVVEHADLHRRRRRRATPATSSPPIQRGGAPDTASTPSTMKTSTSTVPRSGCSMISAIGTAASASASSTSPSRGPRSPSRTSASSIAMPTTSATFASSAGCTWKPPPSTIHEWAPLIVEPSGVSTATSPATRRGRRPGRTPAATGSRRASRPRRASGRSRR